jgi:hypothetical protein
MDGNIKAIVKKGDCEDVFALNRAWHVLNNSYIQRFGVDKEAKKVIDLRMRYAMTMADYLATGDKFYQMEQKILEVDIKMQNNVGAKTDAGFMDIITAVEKHFGFQIDTKITTVEKFYSYLKSMRKESEKLKKFKPEN